MAAGGGEADHGGVPGGPPDPWAPEDAEERGPVPTGDLLEGGLQPPWWQRRWTALPGRWRRLVVALVVLLTVAAAGLWLRDRAAERALAQRVDLAASIGVSSLSHTPPGGQVSFFVVVRNSGALPVRITSVRGASGGLRLRAVDGVDRRVAPGGEAAVPVSVRLSCAQYDGGEGLTTAVAVRREDGGSVTRRLRPRPAEGLLDIATTLCEVRPDLRDEEIAGPVLSAPGS